VLAWIYGDEKRQHMERKNAVEREESRRKEERESLEWWK